MAGSRPFRKDRAGQPWREAIAAIVILVTIFLVWRLP